MFVLLETVCSNRHQTLLERILDLESHSSKEYRNYMSLQQQAAERITKLIADVANIEKRLTALEEGIKRLREAIVPTRSDA